MPQIPTWQDLGKIDPASGAGVASINPNVAYDIGRSGEAWAHAMQSITRAFASLADKKNTSETNAWLSEQKINTLTQEDNIRRNTELSAAPDGSGYEQAPLTLKSHVEETAKNAPNSEAAERYKMFAAERVFETGRWAANTSQKKLRESTVGKLDTRLDEMTNLTTANPEMANDYLKVYEDDIKAATGTAITPSEAEVRLKVAKSQINKTSLIERARQDPASWAKAVAALEGVGITSKIFNNRLPQDRATSEPISTVLETGSKDPNVGVANISKDSAGTHSYGNYGLNSGGSVQKFVEKYGGKFNLTAKPGTKEFDEQWKNAAKASPVELHAAEIQWHNEVIIPRVSTDLKAAGVPENMANDPRVKAYFADRLVQYGPASIGNHAKRVVAAADGAGSVEEFLGNMSKSDLSNYRNDFPTAIKSGVYSLKGHQNRVAGRERLSLQVTGENDVAKVIQPASEKRNIPTVDGSIQPSELLDLDPKDYHAITTELRPYLAVDVETRMADAIAALQDKGAQNIISESDIAALPSIIGVGKAKKYTDALNESKYVHDAVEDLKGSTPSDRIAKINAMVPNGNVESLAAEDKKRYEIYLRVNESINKSIKKNPYEWAVTQNVSGINAYKDIVNNSKIDTPEALKQREKGYDTILKIQESEGVDRQNVRIISQEESEAIVSKIMNAKNGDQAVAIIDGLRAQYGRHFDTVWRDAVKSGLPSSFSIMKTADLNGQNELIKVYALENSLAKESKTNLFVRSGLKKSDLNNAVNSVMGEIRGVISNPNLAEDYRVAVEKLTLKGVIDGNDVNVSSERALDLVMRNKYSLYKGVAIPKEHDTSRTRYAIDSFNGSGSIHNWIMSKDVIDNVDVGDDNKINGIKSVNEYKKLYLNDVAARGKLVSTDNGVAVVDSNNKNVVIKNSAGEREALVIPWENLTKGYGIGSKILDLKKEEIPGFLSNSISSIEGVKYGK